MRLETERLILRSWRESDRIPFRAMNQDPKVMEFFPKTYTTKESDSTILKIEDHFKTHGFGLFATEIKSTQEFIGFVGIQNIPFDSHFTPAIEIGWRLSSDHWGHGYAPEGAREVLRFALEELKLNEILALTTKDNMKSRRVMEKIGMTYDERDDFDHPKLASDHPLRPHVLYRYVSHNPKA